MRTTIKQIITVLFSLMFCSAAERLQAQVNNNSVFQQMFASTATSVGVSLNARNIGQQYHLLTVLLTGLGSCTSNTATGEIYLQGSYDNVNFFPIGSPITTITGGYAATSASGAYAYVNVNYNLRYYGQPPSTSPCGVYATYSGSITGTLTGSAPFTVKQDVFVYAVGSITTSAGQVIGKCILPTEPQVYGVSLTATGGANTATLTQKDTGSGSVLSAYNALLPANNPSLVWPQGSRPYMALLGYPIPSGPVELILSSTASTEIDYVISYRCE